MDIIFKNDFPLQRDMTELVALLSIGKGTWGEVAKVIKAEEWDQVFLVTNEFGRDTFTKTDNMEFIVVNSNESIELLISHIQEALKEKIKGTEVALNMASGTGKEHMAVLSALLKLGVGIRLVTYSVSGLKEI
jgi:hypothetical protein